MRKPKSPNIYNRFNINNYDSSKPIKLLNNPVYKHSTSTDKVNKKIQMNNNYLYGQQFGINDKSNKNKNSIEAKRPSTAPQKYKIKKKSGKNNNVFGYAVKNANIGLPYTYSNGFYAYNKRLPSPMVSGQKFGMTQKLKFNSYRIPLTNNNIFTLKTKKGF